jgi:nucleoside-diphosphate-sugar epimerase
MRAALTGAAGFIGAHVAAALTARGIEVAPLVRPLDYHDRDGVTRVLERERPALLVHCAWRLAAGSSYLDDPANADEAAASFRLFEAAARAGCRRIVGLGTCLEYAPARGPVAEGAPLEPRNAYARSKVQLFLEARDWARNEHVSFAWARLYFPFGPGEPPHRLIPSVVTSLLRGERVATTAGTQRRSFLYAADVGDAIAALGLSGVEGAVNVGAADAVTVRSVVERIGELVRGGHLLDVGALPGRPGDPDVLWPNVDKLRREIGWRPARDLHAGLRATIAWWRLQK